MSYLATQNCWSKSPPQELALMTEEKTLLLLASKKMSPGTMQACKGKELAMNNMRHLQSFTISNTRGCFSVPKLLLNSKPCNSIHSNLCRKTFSFPLYLHPLHLTKLYLFYLFSLATLTSIESAFSLSFPLYAGLK